jgi:cytoskeletal protein CcmA (bactofilin family)
MSPLWKSNHSGSVFSSNSPEPARPVPSTPVYEAAVRVPATPPVSDQASIGKGLLFKGVITGSGSLFVDGEVVGNINLPDSRVTIGQNGDVSDGLSVCINAREIVVMGKVRGNVSASDRVDIRAEGALTGNVSAARISIADGAYFKGDIDLRKAAPKPAERIQPEAPKPQVTVSTPVAPPRLAQA